MSETLITTELTAKIFELESKGASSKAIAEAMIELAFETDLDAAINRANDSLEPYQ